MRRIIGRLESHINEDDMRSTKQTWIGINRGQYKSTSDDWLPNKVHLIQSYWLYR
jgi:hypothetical protein